jgi:hypothetical protein
MSLDVTLTKLMPTNVYGSNITHNLGKMALEVRLECGLTLYDVLWRPEEHNLLHAKDIAELLDEGVNTLLADPVKFKQFEPENGGGNYEGLCNFVYDYRNACWESPEAEIRVSR